MAYSECDSANGNSVLTVGNVSVMLSADFIIGEINVLIIAIFWITLPTRVLLSVDFPKILGKVEEIDTEGTLLSIGDWYVITAFSPLVDGIFVS